MSVGKLCNHNVATIDRDASLTEAAVRMREAHVGDLIVVEHQGEVTVPTGVLTDRDLVIEVLAEKVDPEGLVVADIMSRSLVTVREDNGIEFALKEMHQNGLRRLPVVDTRGSLVGVFTVDDVIGHVARLMADIAETFRIQQYKEEKTRP